MKNLEKIYLHLAIARSGYSSRRKAEKSIREGMVKVNKKTILSPEYKINPNKDTIFISGFKIQAEEEKVYFLLNKPKGTLSAASDVRGGKTVIDLLPHGLRIRVYPVGRLDKDTTGLLILTNDGQLTFRLTHPKFKIAKIYSVLCEGRIEKRDLLKLEMGLEIDGKKTLPAKIRKLKFNRPENRTSLLIEIYEGRKRQIKRMFLSIGHRVLNLGRIKYANLSLGNLKEGEIRPLGKSEIDCLKEKTGLLNEKKVDY